MFKRVIRKVIGSRNDRVLKKLKHLVVKINNLSHKFEQMSDAELVSQTALFQEQLASGTTVDNILPEAFATVREAAHRVLGLRHYDVQLLGGLALHYGNIAEMRTGEGKTLVATLPTYVNALAGQGVHVITVNDYLAKRDSDWMRPVFEFLQLTVGVIIPDLSHQERQAAYACDITYGTNNEFGFDYLRDNMAFSNEEKVQRELNYAVIDEVDSILIDEARTPLIISGSAEDSSDLYTRVNQIIPKLTEQAVADGPGDYTVDEKAHQVMLTDAGHVHIEKMLQSNNLIAKDSSLYAPQNIYLMHYINASLKAHYLYNKDVEYVVQNNEIVIVDEHTGRTMPGRRWSDGIHQAVEAKEKVDIKQENQTLASITFQNFFRLYQKISGMTGTADTEAYEFQQIYKLEVVVIPTNKPMIRKDQTDLVFLDMESKYQAIIDDVQECYEKGQPVLVGTASIDSSEILAKALKTKHIPHRVLNAKYHEQEAHIIAQAGRPKAVTIATNMAGRGTDIVLGGNVDEQITELGDNPDPKLVAKLKQEQAKAFDEVIAAGGLRVIGSERHESRRIDNQLRGRSGRQGDPGSTRFYLCLADRLLRVFANDRLASMMQKLGMKSGEAIEHPWINRAIENAQRKFEGSNFDIRKQLLEYDNVANDHRTVIYSQRREILDSEDVSEIFQDIIADVTAELLERYMPKNLLEDQWDVDGLIKVLASEYALELPISQWLADEDLSVDDMHDLIEQAIRKNIANKQAIIGDSNMRMLEKSIMLRSLDIYWREHLSAMDYLRQGIHLRGYAQKDPKQEYKREAFVLFNSMLDGIKDDILKSLCNIQLDNGDQQHLEPAATLQPVHYENLEYVHADTVSSQDKASIPAKSAPKIGRNAPCHCGSGKKYKNCHGRLV